jgi:hypothetical protein
MFKPFGAVLRAPAGDNDGGGGGDPATQGQSGDGGATSASPELLKVVEGVVGKALGSLRREFETKQTKALEGFKSTLETTFSGLLDGFETKLTEKFGDEGKSKDKKPNGDGVDLASHPQFKALQRKLEESTKAQETLAAERRAEREKSRSTSLHEKVVDILLSQGADPKSVKLAAANLIKVHECVAYESDDSEEIVFREKDGDNSPLESGIKTWVASEEGKRWLAARGAKGSGDGAGGGQRRPTGGGSNGQQPSTGREIGEAILNIAGGKA